MAACSRMAESRCRILRAGAASLLPPARKSGEHCMQTVFLYLSAQNGFYCYIILNGLDSVWG